jgi:hypothetical protein
MRIDARSWGNNQPKLDIGVKADTFQIWKDRALMFLSRDRPDVRKLLTWAEKQTKETLQDGLAQQAAHLGIFDLASVDYALHDGIKTTLMDTLLGRARNCVERGCELWRALCAEWSGAAPQLQMAKAVRYQQPPTCKSMQELWTMLPAWERLGEEVAATGFVIPPWIQMTALDQLLPAQLREALRSRASTGVELVDYAQRLAWVKVQMEYARGVTQADAYAPGGHGKDASGDVNMYSVDNPPGLDADATVGGMTWAAAEATQAGDWALAAQITDTIFALKGAKGRKGFGKGKPGKGNGAAPAATTKGGNHTFDGVCNHCGHYGHRLSECRKRDAELGKTGGGKGGSKGKAGGKSSATGGKGPAASPLAVVGAEDDNWAGNLLDGALADAAEGVEEWDFDTAICSLAAETFAVQPFSGKPAGAPASYASTRRAETKTLAITGAAASASSRPGQYKTYYNASVARPFSGKTFPIPGAAASASSRLAKTQPQPLPSKTFYKTFAGGVAAVLAGKATTKTQNTFAALSLLTDDAEQLLATVSGNPRGGRVVEAVVDSGAVHSVTPPGVFPGPVVPSLWSKTGRGYRAANGTGIKNLGQIGVKFSTAEGDTCNIPFQVAEVDQPLLSVAHLTGAGNRVELGHASGRVVNLKTGRTIALERRGGVYIMRMYLADAVAPAPFGRQGA